MRHNIISTFCLSIILLLAVLRPSHAQVGLGSSEEIDFWYPVYSVTEEDDFPALATDHRDVKLLVWIAYKGNAERLMGKTWRDGVWSPPFHVVPGTGQFFQPAAVSTATGHIWVFWSGQDANGQWDLYTRKFFEGAWSRILRLTHDGGSDLFPDIAAHGNTIRLVWQGFSAGNADIFLMELPADLCVRRAQYGQ